MTCDKVDCTALNICYDCCLNAFNRGDLKELQLLFLNGNLPYLAVEMACAAGYLDIVVWLYSVMPNAFNSTLYKSASSKGHLEVLEYLHKIGINLNVACTDTDTALTLAASGGHMDVVAWLFDHGSPITERLFFWCSKKGYLNIMNYALSKGAIPDALATQYADSLQTLQWLHSKGAVMEAGVISWAAHLGDLERIKWAYEHGVCLSVRALWNAVCATQIHVVYWLVAHKCPMDENCLNECIWGGHWKIFKILHDAGCLTLTRSGLTKAKAFTYWKHLSYYKAMKQREIELQNAFAQRETDSHVIDKILEMSILMHNIDTNTTSSFTRVEWKYREHIKGLMRIVTK